MIRLMIKRLRCWKVAKPADPGSTLGHLEAAIRRLNRVHMCPHPQVCLIMCYLLTIETIETIISIV